ncbi:MAG TPA: hypothetical protein HPP57_07625 [Deltaproteobacteria bacterium]|jgi:hypothetical protein|nr:hypothetical protein [Deltaproteobacteria bacterium]
MLKKKRKPKAGKQGVRMRPARWVDLISRRILWGVEIEIAGRWYPCTTGGRSVCFDYQYDACAYLAMLAQEKGIAWSVR